MVEVVEMGNKLKQLRNKHNLTQKQLADRLGLAVSAVSSYEMGTRYPTYDTLIKLSRIFHVSTDYLLGVDNGGVCVDMSGLSDSDIALIAELVDRIRGNG